VPASPRRTRPAASAPAKAASGKAAPRKAAPRKAGPTDADQADEVRITDPRAIRALAHPARLAIIDAVYGGDQVTATQAAALTGLSASATSYHLRALERWGIVRRAPAAPDGRERPWEAAGRQLMVVTTGSRAAEIADATVLATLLDRDRETLVAYIEGQADEPPEWREAPTASTSSVWLTPEELQELVQGWRTATEQFRGRARSGQRPATARRVRLTLLATPLPRTGQATDGSSAGTDR
jgi:DNA-binding transcriptional ArsR family regulator